MADEQPTEPCYWVLLGTPKGPWTRGELGRQLAAGAIAPETPACAVGTDEWFPCSRLPAEGVPVPAPPTAATAPPPGGEGSSSPATAPGRVRSRAKPPSPRVVGLAIAGGLALLYGAYEWLRPATPMEVCRRFEKAETLADAKNLCTVQMVRVLEQLYADKTPGDPNDDFELTREVDGPDPGVKHVGIRGSWFLPEEGRRVRVEGYNRLVKADGWKVDDMVFTGVEGVSLTRPVSLVDEYRTTAPVKSKPASTTRSTAPSAKSSPRAWLTGWLEQRSTIEILGILSLGVIVFVLYERFKR